MAKKTIKKHSAKPKANRKGRPAPRKQVARSGDADRRRTDGRRKGPQSETVASKPVNRLTQSESGAEIIYGKHSVKAVFLKRPQDIEKLIIAGKEDYHSDLIDLANNRNIDTYLLAWPDFIAEGGFSEDDKHQGVLAVVKPREIFLESELHQLANARCVLVLDQVSNPQNLATIIRSAAFFHADALLYMKNRAATPTAEVVRFAVGGAEMIDMYQITNVSRSLEMLKDMGFTVLGLDERGERTLAQHDLNHPTAFVVGAEGEGLRNKTRQYCSDLVRIPGGLRGVESLNAAVATTIALYEFARLGAGDKN
ncbi:MAG: hypothetical protein GKR97_01650 [Rhizobiaceae bacterium]|nr:hypothetical protein [Rhizobiaceae bacterium]